jgi:dihydropteroate synthase
MALVNGAPLLWRCGPAVLPCGLRTLVMGIVNVTPDSFSDGGELLDAEAAAKRALEMVLDGADILDIGGESTRPGSTEVPADVELERVLPVIGRLREQTEVPLSIDTRKAEVAVEALRAGATIVNDVSAGADPGMFEAVRASGAGMVLMHMQGEPSTMQSQPRYDDVVAEVHELLRQRADAAVRAGIERDRLCIDPGIGFGKALEHNLLLLRDVRVLLDLGLPVLVGPSRKRFLGTILGTEVGDRLEGTAAAVAWLAAMGVHVVRVHDVKEMARVARVIDAISKARTGP